MDEVDVLGGELEGGRLEVDVAARAAPEQGVAGGRLRDRG